MIRNFFQCNYFFSSEEYPENVKEREKLEKLNRINELVNSSIKSMEKLARTEAIYFLDFLNMIRDRWLQLQVSYIHF